MHTKVILKSEAREIGLSRYFTGKPCPKGHVSERYVSCGHCVECTSEYAKENRKEIKAEYWNENRNAINEARRSRYAKNKSAEREKKRKYIKSYLKRPHVKSERFIRESLRRIRVSSGFQVSDSEIGYTREQLTEHIESLFDPEMSWENHGEWHIDHIVPISYFVRKGISNPAIVNSLQNLTPVWGAENMSKSDQIDKTTEELFYKIAGESA